MMITTTTGRILAARGVRSRKVLWRDLDAGLFVGCEPVRRPATPGAFAAGSPVGNPLVWPLAAMRRARLIAEYIARGWGRPQIATRLRGGHLLPYPRAE